MLDRRGWRESRTIGGAGEERAGGGNYERMGSGRSRREPFNNSYFNIKNKTKKLSQEKRYRRRGRSSTIIP